MTARDAVSYFQWRAAAPIRVGEISRWIVSQGVQDQIRFIGTDGDTGVRRAHLDRYTKRPTPYSEPDWFADIYYERRQAIEWQRLACAKELLHILDPHRARTKTRADVSHLIRKMAQAPSLPTDDANDQEKHDRALEYYAAAALFPWKLREKLLHEVASGLSIDNVCRFVRLPPLYVTAVLSEFWPTFLREVVGVEAADALGVA